MFLQPTATDNPPAAQGAASVPEQAPVNDFVGSARSLAGRFTDGDVTADDVSVAWSSLGWPVVKALILIIVMLLLARSAQRFVTAACRGARVDETLARFFGNTCRWSVILLGGIAILKTFGVDTTSFAAAIAAVGFALGMALSGTLGNFAAGVMLLVFRPFRVGDVVSAGGVTGQIDEIGMFTTTFDTHDNRRIIVPNGSIYGATIENITFHAKRRVDVAVGTAYSADVDETRRVLLAAATRVEGRTPESEPVVFLNELGASAVEWSVRVWAPTADYWTVRERLTREVKVALDGAGIGIPFPQRELILPAGIDVRVRST